MAVPFTIPNEDTDEYYRVLARLLRDVLEVLNLLVRRPPPPPPPRNRSAPVVNRAEDRSAPLPDLVQCTMTSVERLGAATTTIAERLQDPYCPVPRPRPCADIVPPQPAPRRTNRTRRRIRNTTRSENWAQVGEDLKMIADAFTDTTREAQTSTEEVDDEKKQQDSLLSLLMPPPFSSSVWTAVIFFVGWRLLSGRGR